VPLVVPREPLPLVRADREFLSDAVERLVENAIKFSPPGAGPVALTAEAAPRQVLIHVSDHGRGIRPEDLTKIFDLFYQSERARHEQQGIGAGLTIAAAIVAMHGGSLSATSTPGQGSTFTIALPALS